MVRSRGILKENVIRQLSSDAEARLQPLLGQLASAGVEARTEVQLSEEPQAILDVARRHGCNSIVVLGRPIVGARRRWLSATGCVGHHLGARLAALSDTPVTVLPIDAGI
ncbi:MAG TPA: universal stress protein [Hyphomicrobiaceae bacterium]|nr:universal stress protein [Hyphomicrobiaceae bacterium]